VPTATTKSMRTPNEREHQGHDGFCFVPLTPTPTRLATGGEHHLHRADDAVAPPRHPDLLPLLPPPLEGAGARLASVEVEVEACATEEGGGNGMRD
jgi:hypothetical protein